MIEEYKAIELRKEALRKELIENNTDLIPIEEVVYMVQYENIEATFTQTAIFNCLSQLNYINITQKNIKNYRISGNTEYSLLSKKSRELKELLKSEIKLGKEFSGARLKKVFYPKIEINNKKYSISKELYELLSKMFIDKDIVFSYIGISLCYPEFDYSLEVF